MAIKLKRGLEATIPTLQEGEPGFTTDSKKLFVGSDAGNIEIGTKQAIDEVAIELNTHDESNTAHLPLRTLINDLQKEIDRINAKGRSWGEVDKTFSELWAMTEPTRSEYINTFLTIAFSDYTPSNGDLVYTIVSDTEEEHELEYNSTLSQWVDNGAYIVGKASNTQHGIVKGDSDYVSILNGIIQVLKSDYATNIGSNGASYDYDDLLGLFTEVANDIYKKNETYSATQIEQRITDLLGLANLLEGDGIPATEVEYSSGVSVKQKLDDLDLKKADKTTLTNLVTNGDLLIDSNSDNIPDGFTYSANTTDKTLVNGIAKFTATAQFGRLQYVLSGFNTQTMYVFARFKADGNVRLSNTNGATASHSGSGQFEFLSLVETLNSDTCYIQVSDYRTSDWTPIEVDYIGAINLTATFGAGNEPTKERMDAIMKENGFFQTTTLNLTTANEVYYNNSTSGFVADNVQGAIDEVVGNVEQKLQSIVADNLITSVHYSLLGTDEIIYSDYFFIPYSKFTNGNWLNMVFKNVVEVNATGGNCQIGFFDASKALLSSQSWFAAYWRTLSSFSLELTPHQDTVYVGIRCSLAGADGTEKSGSLDIEFSNGQTRQRLLNNDIEVYSDESFSLTSGKAIKNSVITENIMYNEKSLLEEVLQKNVQIGFAYTGNIGIAGNAYSGSANTGITSKLKFEKDVAIYTIENNLKFHLFLFDENYLITAKTTYARGVKIPANTTFLLVVVKTSALAEQDVKTVKATILRDDCSFDIGLAKGSIPSATGVVTYDSSVTVNRVITLPYKVNDFYIFSYDNVDKLKMGNIYFYDSNLAYLGRVPIGEDGYNYWTPEKMLSFHPTAKFVRFLFGYKDNSDMTIEQANACISTCFKKEAIDKIQEQQEFNAVRKTRFDNMFQAIAYSSTYDNSAPINSLQQYIAVAKNPDYQGVKGDLRITSDNKLVMCHDEGYTFDSEGRIITFNNTDYTPIRNLTYAEVMALEFATQYQGEYVHPTDIDGLLRTCKKYGKIPYITVRDQYVPDYAPILMQKIRQYGFEQTCIVNSFSADALRYIRLLSNSIMLSQVQASNVIPNIEKLKLMEELGNAMICLFVTNLSILSGETYEAFMAEALNKDIRVYNAIMSQVEDIDTLVNLGFAGTQTYVPYTKE